MISNVEELLAEGEKIKDIEGRTRFILNYFSENVKYSYAFLFAKGYAQGDVSAVSGNFGVSVNKLRNNGDEERSEYVLTRSILEGESRIFNDILILRDENSGDYNKFIKELRAYITKELNSHLRNDTLVAQAVDEVVEKVEEGLREKTSINGIEVNYDISKVLTDFFIEPKKYFPPEYSNGLITNGVCEDYTKYLVPLLQKAGIEAHEVYGTSVLGHAWVIVKDGDKYKSVDLTRAVAIRDGFLGIPPEQTMDDWIYSDVEDIFKMQKTRTIREIDGKKLPYVIDGENYDEVDFYNIMKDEILDSTFKSFLKAGLEDGITSTEVLNAELAERIEKDMGRVGE